MKVTRARGLRKTCGAPAFKTFAPLAGTGPIGVRPAAPQDVAVNQTTGDGVDLARQSDRRRVVLLLAALLDLAEGEVEKPLVCQSQSSQAGIVAIFSYRVSG